MLDHLWSYMVRVAVNASLGISQGLVLNALIPFALFLHHRASGEWPRNTRDPELSTRRMVLTNFIGITGYMLPWALVAAAVAHTGWSYEFPNLIKLGYWVHFMLLIHDAYYFLAHRWFHSKARTYRLLHAAHHDPAVQLNTTTSATTPWLGAVIEGGIFILLILLATYHFVGNWWYFVGFLHHSFVITIGGHAGREMFFDSCTAFAIPVVVDPFMLWFNTTPSRAAPMDHQAHHTNPRSNFAPYFTHWDEWCGSSNGNQAPYGVLVHLCHAAYQAVLFATLYCWFTHPVLAATTYVLVYVMVSPTMAASLFGLFNIPELCQGAFGWLADRYRRANAVTFASAGSSGAFTDDTDGNANGKDASNSGAQQGYIFGCHPTGVLSRGAYLTFALRGWKSPVTHLKGLRLAVGNQLFYTPIPLFREFLLATGCIPADKSMLLRHLQQGNSLAIHPGGWREIEHMRTNNVILQKRKGFVSLAKETGAGLVPVLCVGEQDVVLPPRTADEVYKYKGMKRWFGMFLVSHRPHPTKVVFGAVIIPGAEESVDDLHARYVAALTELGTQHGMPLHIA